MRQMQPVDVRLVHLPRRILSRLRGVRKTGPTRELRNSCMRLLPAGLWLHDVQAEGPVFPKASTRNWMQFTGSPQIHSFSTGAFSQHSPLLAAMSSSRIFSQLRRHPRESIASWLPTRVIYNLVVSLYILLYHNWCRLRILSRKWLYLTTHPLAVFRRT